MFASCLLISQGEKELNGQMRASLVSRVSDTLKSAAQMRPNIISEMA